MIKISSEKECALKRFKIACSVIYENEDGEYTDMGIPTKHFRLEKGEWANDGTKTALRDWNNGIITDQMAIDRIRKFNNNDLMFDDLIDFYLWAQSLGYDKESERVAEIQWKGYDQHYMSTLDGDYRV